MRSFSTHKNAILVVVNNLLIDVMHEKMRVLFYFSVHLLRCKHCFMTQVRQPDKQKTFSPYTVKLIYLNF